MPVTLHQLRVFLALAETEHMGRAARAVHRSQPAVSMALSELEGQLGQPLFERTGRGLHLNEGGRRLRPHAREVLRRVGEVETLLGDGGEVSGRLRVGASSTIGLYLLPRIVAAFTADHPQADVRLETGNTRHVRERVLDHALDVGFVEGPAGQHAQLRAEPWRADDLVLFCAPSHPLAGTEPLSPKRVGEVRWVLREEGSGTRAVFERALGEARTHLRRVLELGHSEAVRRAVEAGAGVGCLSRLCVEEQVDSGRLTLLRAPESWDLRRTFRRITRRSAYASRLQAAFTSACDASASL